MIMAILEQSLPIVVVFTPLLGVNTILLQLKSRLLPTRISTSVNEHPSTAPSLLDQCICTSLLVYLSERSLKIQYCKLLISVSLSGCSNSC